MDLSVSPAAHNKLKDLLICLSLGNLCFLRRWYDLEHLKERSVDYYRTAPADPTLLLATVSASLLLTAMLWAAWLWVKRNPTSGRLKLAQCVFLLLLIFPLESVRRYWNFSGSGDLVTNASLFAIEGVLAIGLVLALFNNTRIVRAARHATLLLTLLIPSLMIDFTWSRLSAETGSAYLPRPSLPMLPPHAGARRLVWVLFDELDEHLAFEVRPASLQLPQLDRLRGQSFVATQTRQTAGWTTLALPSLISGVMFQRAELVDSDTLRVVPEGSKTGTDWRDQPNVFRRARELGLNAELVGWHHPYCRVFGDSLVRCLDVPSETATPASIRETEAREAGYWNMLLFLFRLQLENLRDMLRFDGVSTSDNLRDAFVQRHQQQQYFKIRDRAYAGVSDPQIQFLFVHFPVPHPFAIYDSRRGDFTLSKSTSYFDNLALVDRTVGELRSKLEKAGLWDSTSILITSDHGLRPDLWRGHYNWTPETERLAGNTQSEIVPFIVKLGGQDRGMIYEKPFSAVVTGDLCLAILGGHVSTAAEVSVWLDEHAALSGKSAN